MSFASEVLADSPLIYARLGEAAATQPAVTATTASSEFSGTFNAAKAFDGLTSSSWTTASGSTGWVRVQYASGFTATRYAVTGRREATPNRTPTAWTFEGSNDGSSWTTLDTQSSLSWSANETKVYTFSNATSFSYYRLNVSANAGDALLNVTEIIVSGATDLGSAGLWGKYLNAPTFEATGALVGDANTAVTFASASSEDLWFPWVSSFDITTLTLECWVKTTGTTQAILGREGTTSAPYSLFVNGSGALQCVIKNSGTSGANYDGSATINDGSWHHVAAVRNHGTSELWLYVDGVQDAYHASTVVPQSSSGVGFRVASRGNAYLNGSVDEAALYPSALSAARILAHYEAGLGNIDIAGEAFASSATMLDGSARTQVLVAGDVFASAATFLDGSIISAPITVSGDVFTVATTMLDGSAQTQVLVAGERFASAATMLDGGIMGAPIPGEPFSVATVFLDGGMVVTSATDTSNFYNGRRRGGLATVELDVPVATPPVASTVVRVDKAIALPEPVLVKGRPT